MEMTIKIGDQEKTCDLPLCYDYATLSESGRLYVWKSKPHYSEILKQWEGFGEATDIFYNKPIYADDTLVRIIPDTRQTQAELIMEMDKTIRSVNDEENGVFERWILYYVPDESTVDEIKDILDLNPNFYQECCDFFVKEVTNLINNGETDNRGFCVEFWKGKDVQDN